MDRGEIFAFQHTRDAPRLVRERLRAFVIDLEPSVAADVLLLASELVSNVVEHTTGGGTVRVWRRQQSATIRLEVTDSDEAMPTTTLGSLGLRTVEMVASAWGVHVHGTGKSVWAEIAHTRKSRPMRAARIGH